MVRRIVSGGQTGADRAALDFALEHGFECGGWVPKGRLAEDGIIPLAYPNLSETDSDNPSVRTERNVLDSDATLLVTHGKPLEGSALTLELASRLRKPLFHVDFERESLDSVIGRLRQWLQEVHPVILNVAGPRRSEDQEIYDLTKALLKGIFPV